MKKLPHEIDKSSLSSDFGLDSICKIHRCFIRHSSHGRQVPNLANNGPRGHHEVNVRGHSVLRTIPKGIAKYWIVLDGHRVNGATYFKTAFLELHHRSIIDARALRENQNGQFCGIINVLFQPKNSSRYLLCGAFRIIQRYIFGRFLDSLRKSYDEFFLIDIFNLDIFGQYQFSLRTDIGLHLFLCI